MSLADLLSGLLRRWYITIPGILLAIAAAVGTWYVVPPGYERSATQLLLPGAQSMPEKSNPLLYLGGLSNAADVLVRAVGSENIQTEIKERYPGVKVEVIRDGSTAGPIILITVTASSDRKAVAALEDLTARTSVVLDELQSSEQIPPENRITAVLITTDDKSVLQQRDRLVAVFAVGLAVTGLVLLLAGLVDGILRRRRRRRDAEESAETEGEADAAPGAVDHFEDADLYAAPASAESPPVPAAAPDPDDAPVRVES